MRRIPKPNTRLQASMDLGRGTIQRAAVAGREMAATQLFRIRAGQFIYSRLKSFEGAYAIVSPEVDGYFVSNEFPTFDLHRERLDPGFPRLVFQAGPKFGSNLLRTGRGSALDERGCTLRGSSITPLPFHRSKSNAKSQPGSKAPQHR